MKKRFLALLIAAMVLLTACAPAGQGEQTTPPESQTTQTQPTDSTLPASTEEDPSSEPTAEAGEQTDPSQEPLEPAENTQPATEPAPKPTEPTKPTEAATEPTEKPTETPTEPTDAPTEASGDAAIVDAAYALAPGQSLPGTYTLSGTVSSIVTAYSQRYGNITVNLLVPGSEDQPIQCFRLEGTGVEYLEKGDQITVSGTLMNYKGTVEFDAGCRLVSYTLNHPIPEQTQPPQTGGNNDDSRDAVAAYIHQYGCLPEFYLTKSEARSLYGWTGGPLDKLAPGLCIGGDTFSNYQKILPDAPGRRWTECDIDTIGAGARGAKRIVFSNDGLIYYTDDHYESFTLLYGEP